MESRSSVPQGEQYFVQEEISRPNSLALKTDSSIKTYKTNFALDTEYEEETEVEIEGDVDIDGEGEGEGEGEGGEDQVG